MNVCEGVSLCVSESVSCSVCYYLFLSANNLKKMMTMSTWLIGGLCLSVGLCVSFCVFLFVFMFSVCNSVCQQISSSRG